MLKKGHYRVTFLALVGSAIAFHFLPLMVPKKEAKGLPMRNSEAEKKEQ